MSSRRGAAAAAAMVVMAALGGCGSDSPGPIDEDAAWLTSSDPVDTSPVVWAADGVVHLADGTEIDLGAQPASYVVAGDGVFFVPADNPQQAETGSDASAAVHFVEPEGDPVETGLRLRADSVRASPDGRYLLGVDVESGPEDDYGTPLAELVVLDLTEGREVLRTSENFGDLDGDLADLYGEIQVSVLDVTPTTAEVLGTDGPFLVDLATGAISDPEETEETGEPWRSGVIESPDGRWRITTTGKVSQVVDSEGVAVPLEIDAVRWLLEWWADATTVVGIAGAEDGSSALVTCVVPDGRCEVYEATRGETIRYPNGSTYPLVASLLDAHDD
ncbi:hypothetical protein EXE58_05895 [Nocardioides seonyuensis]|uniref:Uncharacterized protein n=1 Tax=Nocardioides seonyuensis TaxID=2518371 RepID=A0A4P7IH16_9ACTN|nr:hypothetical protein [Nocardioides seonyuensis]QBX55031.1 hypothetical protein EXE58_05895 [Nocardioides seonyuensis]